MAKVLTLSGSVREGSHNLKLQRAMDTYFAEAGYEVEHGDLGAFDLPIFQEGLKSDAAADVQKLVDLVNSADLVFIATPEYNGGLPPVLVNATTWISLEKGMFADRVWAIGGVSNGKYGTIAALNHLRDCISKMGGFVLPGLLGIGPASEAFDADDALVDPVAQRKISRMIDAAQKLVPSGATTA